MDLRGRSGRLMPLSGSSQPVPRKVISRFNVHATSVSTDRVRQSQLSEPRRIRAVKASASGDKAPFEEQQQSVRMLDGDVVSRLEPITEGIKGGKFKNIIIMTGAGISVSAGIPDFRTPGTGLFYNLQKYNLPYAEAVFDIQYFQVNPVPFFQLAKAIYPGLYTPTAAHNFIKRLHDEGLLLRCYTQNIDGLERLAGIPDEKLVEAHGTFASARCIRCSREVPEKHVRKCIILGDIPIMCACGGLVKPDIVFYGEGLPDRFHKLAEEDLPRCDLLIVMGTSLAVYPFAGLVELVNEGTPRMLINREAVGLFANANLAASDIPLLGDCDAVSLSLLSEWGLSSTDSRPQPSPTVKPKSVLHSWFGSLKKKASPVPTAQAVNKPIMVEGDLTSDDGGKSGAESTSLLAMAPASQPSTSTQQVMEDEDERTAPMPVSEVLSPVAGELAKQEIPKEQEAIAGPLDQALPKI